MVKYIDIDLLREKIVREVEQWKDKTANHYTIEAEARWSEANYILGILDSLQQEQSEQFMAKLQKSLEAGHESIKSSLADIDAVGEVLSSLGTFDKEHDKRLEIASEEYEKKHTYQRYDGGGFTPEYDATLAEAFQAGKEWKEEQCKGCFVRGEVFRQGMLHYHEQMLEVGIDCEVKIDAGGYPYIERTIELYDYEKDEPLAKKGDKYKLVLLKVK